MILTSPQLTPVADHDEAVCVDGDLVGVGHRGREGGKDELYLGRDPGHRH